MKRAILYCLLLGCLATLAAAQEPTIFVVRHAERADAGSGASPTSSSDPELSETGRARAEALARTLKDAEITAVYATEFKRTQQTAAPLARGAGLTVTIVPAKETASFVAKLKASQGNALVVAHSNTILEIVKSLGITTPINVAEFDYDSLFVIMSGVRPRLIHLHYGGAR